MSVKIDRRQFLELTAVSCISAVWTPPLLAASKDTIVNDVSHLNPTTVADVKRPRSTEEVRSALRSWSGSVSVGGSGFSMGGQIAEPGSRHLDMREMSQVIYFDASSKLIRVQAGITWRDIQDVIDPHDLAVKIMQSYSNFTVGGSLSVNCHGRYIGRGPVVNSVRAVQMVTVNGEILELSRSHEPELFSAIFGGYGGLGVITEVVLELEDNTRIERIMKDVMLTEYPSYFRKNIISNPNVLMHNADLIPPNFSAPRGISWVATDKALTHSERLVPRGLNYTLEKNAIWALTELPGAGRLRETVDDLTLQHESAITWRNHEASFDNASLEPRTRAFSTYLLQEYFIPVENFLPFSLQMAIILKVHNVHCLNVSIRHSPADTASLMKWAPVEVFSFVIYYKQRTSQQASDAVRVWTRKLIDLALANGGRYYLPYRLDATNDQFLRAYPEARAFSVLKARVDPDNRLRNLLWDKYLPLT